MTLRTAVATPFIQHGTARIRINEFVVALSLDRRWFSPDQSKRLIDRAIDQGLLIQDGQEIELTIDPSTVTIPDDFEPSPELFREQSPFETVLERSVERGMDKQAVVGAINGLQRDLGVTIDAAAIVFGKRNELEIDDIAKRARERLLDDQASEG